MNNYSQFNKDISFGSASIPSYGLGDHPLSAATAGRASRQQSRDRSFVADVNNSYHDNERFLNRFGSVASQTNGNSHHQANQLMALARLSSAGLHDTSMNDQRLSYSSRVSSNFTPISQPSMLQSTTMTVQNNDIVHSIIERTRADSQNTCHTSSSFDADDDGDTLTVFDENEDFSIRIPEWHLMDLSSIYDALNPSTKLDKKNQIEWKKKAIDVQGKPIQLKVIVNRLLKALVSKALLSDTASNKTLMTKKQERLSQRAEFLSIDGPENIFLIQKFLSENILPALNVDGKEIMADEISLNLGARVIMLAVESEPSFEIISDIFKAPEKK